MENGERRMESGGSGGDGTAGAAANRHARFPVPAPPTYATCLRCLASFLRTISRFSGER